MDRKHALASASGAKRWMKCTASCGFIERNLHQLPEERDSVYSLEGTEAHDMAAACLMMGGFEPSIFRDPDMAKYVKGYVELIQGWAEPDTDTLIESAVPLFYHEHEDGFLDAAVVHRGGKFIRVGDLKYGAGVSVQAKENEQLAIYAKSIIQLLSALYPFTDDTLVSLVIYQPRIEGEAAVRQWNIRLKDLNQFCAKIGAVAEEIYRNPNGGKFAPADDTCRFCDAVAICGARAAQLFGATPDDVYLAVAETKPHHFPLAESLTLDQLTRIVAIAPEFKEWLGKCEAAGAARLHDNLPFHGYKLVEGRSNRAWRDEAEAVELMALTELPPSEMVNVKVISPAQAEEKLSKQDWDAIKHAVVKPEGKPIMVPESDPRPAILVNPANFFPNLEQDTGLLS